ncbi:MAG: GNAT family N-acetyltransferase [Legionella sp.]|nr:GNAT family N-acetyltransferase [Legionella sp.]
MITFAPSPRWTDLVKTLIPKKIDSDELAKPWLRDNDQAYWFSRTAWSLQAIVLLWEKIFSKKEPTVWIPDYFPNQSLWPMRQTSAKIIFYPIKEGLQPNWVACETLLKNHTKPDIFILTHYYGLLADAKKAKTFCKLNQAILVEDAAHILIPMEGVGEHCHISLYSPHKHFSLPNGAICAIRPSFNKYVRKMGGEEADMQDILNSIGHQSPPVLTWFTKKIIQKITKNKLTFLKKSISYEEDGTSNPISPKPQASLSAKKLLSFSLKKIPEYSKHRQQCAEVWDHLLDQNKIRTDRVLSTQDEIPYVAVYSSRDNEAATLYNHLSNKKWPVSSWPDLPPEVRQNPDIHAATIHFRNNMLIFPTNQSLSFTELAKRYAVSNKNKRQNYALLEIQYTAWNEYYYKIQQSNLLQSWWYGLAQSETSNWLITHHVITKNNTPIALVQIRKKKLGYLTLVRINRGPLWIHEDKKTEDIDSVLQLLHHTFALLKGFLLVLTPELSNSPQTQLLLYQNKYHALKTKKIGSIWIDLSPSENELRSLLKSNWRRQLSASERHDLQFDSLKVEEKIDWFLEKYDASQDEKKFSGLSKNLILKLIQFTLAEPTHTPYLFQVTHNNQPIAVTLIVRHGLACTYLLVWTDETLGRKLNVSNFLLWHSILTMKKIGCLWFDLGGISEADKKTSAITSFKKGLSGITYWLPNKHLSL